MWPRFALLFLVASWLQPLHVGPWVSWHNEILAFFGLIAMGAWVWIPKTEPARTQPVPLALLFPLLLLLVVWAQWSAGSVEYLGDAIVTSGYIALFTLALLVGWEWSNRDKRKNYNPDPSSFLFDLATAVLVGATLSVLVALVQVLDIWDSTFWITPHGGDRRPGANLAQANQYGTLVLMGVASLFYIYQVTALSKVIAISAALWLCLGLAISESRTAFVGLATLLIWSLWKRQCFQRDEAVYSVLAFFLIFLGVLWCWPTLLAEFHLRGGATSERVISQLGNAGLRRDVWLQLLDAATISPWLGWGIAGVTQALTSVADRYETSGPFTYSHNIILDFCIWIGVPLTIALLGGAALWGWRRLKATQTTPAWFCWALVIPVAVHSLLEFPYAYAYFVLPLGLVIGYQEGRSDSGRTVPVPRTHLLLVLAAFCILMATTVLEYLTIEEDYRIVRLEDLKIGRTPDDHVQPDVILLTQLGSMLKAGRTQPQAKMTDSELEILRQASERYPWPALQHRYALALALNSYDGHAMRMLRVIRSMHGRQAYENIKLHWLELSVEKHPQLKTLIKNLEENEP